PAPPTPPATALHLRVPAAEAPMEPELCYVLDAVLFLYGIVLTVLYCRLKVGTTATGCNPPPPLLHQGLSTEQQDTYEMLEPKS
uniref:Fc receptor gamma-chain n=1 Tax=Anas platyrhynchos TaxID=8839 RepID=A0A8B9ZFG0_ANAPL